jgi:hypothetical protein
MDNWTQQPRSLAYLQQLLETLATLRRIELLSKLKKAHDLYATQVELEHARERQRALTQQLAATRAKTQGTLTQELHEARTR